MMFRMSEEKKFHIVFTNKKTDEVKILSTVKSTFKDAVSHAFKQSEILLEKTGESWEIAHIYDISFKYELKNTLY